MHAIERDCNMNAISPLTRTNDGAATSYSAPSTATGLGPNQLSWLRRSIDAFRELEELRRQVQEDTVRSARMAGLI
jgi:hypothetical protein